MLAQIFTEVMLPTGWYFYKPLCTDENTSMEARRPGHHYSTILGCVPTFQIWSTSEEHELDEL